MKSKYGLSRHSASENRLSGRVGRGDGRGRRALKALQRRGPEIDELRRQRGLRLERPLGLGHVIFGDLADRSDHFADIVGDRGLDLARSPAAADKRPAPCPPCSIAWAMLWASASTSGAGYRVAPRPAVCRRRGWEAPQARRPADRRRSRACGRAAGADACRRRPACARADVRGSVGAGAVWISLRLRRSARRGSRRACLSQRGAGRPLPALRVAALGGRRLAASPGGLSPEPP